MLYFVCYMRLRVTTITHHINNAHNVVAIATRTDDLHPFLLAVVNISSMGVVIFGMRKQRSPLQYGTTDQSISAAIPSASRKVSATVPLCDNAAGCTHEGASNPQTQKVTISVFPG